MNDAVKPTTTHKRRARTWLSALLLGACGLVVLSTCSPRPGVVQQVQQLGVLRVATINSPTTYYVGADGATGFEYDLALGLAERLGVKLEILLAANPAEALEMVKRGQAHFAAAGLSVTPERARELRFTHPLLSVVPQLVYRARKPKPKDLNDLQGTLTVVENSAQAERLRDLKLKHPQLQWTETRDYEPEELLYKVAQDELDYTVANSDLVAINQRYYPKLRVAFAVADSQDLAWAFPRGSDDSLYAAASEYLHEIGGTELARLRDRYFGHIEQVDYLGAVALATHVDTRLPRYRADFEAAGEKLGLDWRLLAAIGYQESHWDPAALSPTGVRGIMQLTQATADFLRIADREDPAQSIWGGSRYFRQLLDQLPEDIKDPERTWLALAGYNMGIGHLYDAQQLTKEQGGDPKRWLDVRNALPLLTKSRWHSRTKHGYARGHEAVNYVGNVRTYYDMLVWITGGAPQLAEPAAVETVAPAEEKKPPADPLNIRTPVL